MNLIFDVPDWPAAAEGVDRGRRINIVGKTEQDEAQPIQIVFKNMDQLTIVSAEEQLEESWKALLLPQIEQAFAPVEKDKRAKKLLK